MNEQAIKHMAKYQAKNSKLTRESIEKAFLAGYEEARKWYLNTGVEDLPAGYYLVKGDTYQGIRLAIWDADNKCWLNGDDDGKLWDSVKMFKKV